MTARLYLLAFVWINLCLTERPPFYTYLGTYKYEFNKTDTVHLMDCLTPEVSRSKALWTCQYISINASSTCMNRLQAFNDEPTRYPYKDLLLSSPTSSWLDMPAVGHVQIFLNHQTFPFFGNNTIYLRGNPVPLSFFGFDVQPVNDLNNDNIGDILVSALKVSENDKRGGVYIFLGGNEATLKHLKYYEPRTNFEIPAFGFSIETEFRLNQFNDTCKYCLTRKKYLNLNVNTTTTPDPVFIDERICICHLDYLKKLINQGAIPITIERWFESIPPKILVKTEISHFEDRSENEASYTQRDLSTEIIFVVEFHNYGDFLRYLILRADIPIPCDLKMILKARVFERSIRMLQRMMVNISVYKDHFILKLEAMCSQPFNKETEQNKISFDIFNDDSEFTLAVVLRGDKTISDPGIDVQMSDSSLFIALKRIKEEGYTDKALVIYEVEHAFRIIIKRCAQDYIAMLNYKKGIIKVRNIVKYVTEDNTPPQENINE
ncbi:hypothetical protein RF11_00532 [Thelohanellus kitauei]|uniref:Uncharacterized protein n=1 Tax=Thelohanellus kitauei TaxID=669202 RepID=A0A0C2NEI3_THEKT|nr:hypothetical protein RF11_00532 [Thelohanellus kitauei]